MDDIRLLSHKLRNRLQSAALMGLLALLLVYLAWMIGGGFLAWFSLGVVVILSLANPAASPRLAMALYRARPLAYEQAPRLYAVVAELARRAGLPRVPVLYYLPTRVMNAFTTGVGGDAAIAVSDGMLRGLRMRELTGVLAHEVSHIANGDTRVMGFADLVSRITGTLSLMGQVLLLVSLPLWVLTDAPIPWVPILVLVSAPTLSALVQLALSRNREYEADRSAAELSGDPLGLASALQKLERVQSGVWERLVMPGPRIPEPSLLRTHPPTEERVRRLGELAVEESTEPVLGAFPGISNDDLLALLGAAHPAAPRRRITGLWY